MIDFKNNKTFCPYFFKGAMVDSNKNVTPCCRFDDSESLSVEPVTKVQESGSPFIFNDIWSVSRKKVLNGETIPGCHKCYRQEEEGNMSMRTSAIKNFKETELLMHYDAKAEKGLALTSRGPSGLKDNISNVRLEYLEIETGRYCNLKCRSCGPNLSTSWDEDLVKDKRAEVNFYGNDIKQFKSKQLLPKINLILSNLTYDDCKHLKELKVTGGEPFLSDAFLKFLSNMVEWNLAENIILDIFTNCSFFPKEKYRDMLPKFKNVLINLSLDAISDRAEFMRKKSKWNIVEQVSTYWEKLALESLSVNLAISHTVSIFNVLYFEEFILWCNKHFDSKTLQESPLSSFLQAIPVYGPLYLCVTNFSDSSKDKIVQQLEQQWERVKAQLLSSNVIENKKFWWYINVEDSYKKLIKYVKGPMTKEYEGQEGCKKEFIEKTEMFDEIRNENWKEVFPELVEMLND